MQLVIVQTRAGRARMQAEPFSLLAHQWLPVRRRSGPATIRPAQIAEALDYDPVLEIVWPRPDFRIAAIEFLIALLSTFAPPPDEGAWVELWHHPPSPEELDAAFRPFAHAFTLDGNGPRFMQDFATLDGEANPAGTLLIEAPGANTLRNNADLLVKRGRVNRLSRPAAAIALFTLQIYGPAGGAGHRTGLRGGGPLTTLIQPCGERDRPAPLWRLLWAHVASGKPMSLAALPGVLPWLAPTATSEKGQTALAAGLRPEHALWSMPRRIRLDFETNAACLPCDLSGTADSVMVTGWRTRPHGLFYLDWSPPHPLSPHYRQKKTDLWLPVHVQPTGIGYRDWVGLIVSDADKTRAPAEAVWRFRSERAYHVGEERPRLLAAGYDMDNMKARGFAESEMPLPPTADAETAQRIDERVRRFVTTAGIAADLLRFAVRSALFSPGAKIDLTGATLLAGVRDRFWRDTEPAFFARLPQMRDIGDDHEAFTRDWLGVLRYAALEGFDAAAPLDPEQYRKTNGGRPEQPIVRARGVLAAAFNGHGSGGNELFKTLDLAPPEATRQNRKKPGSVA